MIFRLLVLACAVSMTLTAGRAGAEAIVVDGQVPPFRVWHVLKMPGETLDLKIPEGLIARVDGAVVVSSWRAPDTPGNHTLVIASWRGQEMLRMSIFVLAPSTGIDDGGYMEGYRIGSYPEATPAGFIRLAQGDDDLPLSPSLTIGQFVCKQQPTHFPKFLLVTTPNVVRLEALLRALRHDGLTAARRFHVMSGFRTPYYNAAIGSAPRSRHLYGDAADIFVDVALRDGVMDDLNGDGVIDKADADFLYDYAENLFAEGSGLPEGGLGPYRTTAAHGPFLHSDGRGIRARWGRGVVD